MLLVAILLHVVMHQHRVEYVVNIQEVNVYMAQILLDVLVINIPVVIAIAKNVVRMVDIAVKNYLCC
tara:strand:+ start:110 stop:310 length:201 start_codon:yes stop_codon:yes gene_type:complete